MHAIIDTADAKMYSMKKHQYIKLTPFPPEMMVDYEDFKQWRK